MPLEYEYRYRIFNKTHIIARLKELGAVCEGKFLFKVQVFIHPNEVPDTYIRVRDEGHRITMTYKYTNTKTHFPIENEVQIDNLYKNLIEKL